MPQPNVEKLAKEADELHRKLYPEQYGDPPSGDDTGTPATPAPDQPTDSGAPPNPAPEGAGEPPGAPADGTPPAPPPNSPSEQPAPGTAPQPPSETNWEGRYNALQGKYNAEVPRLAAEVAALKQQLSESAKPPAATPPANEPSKPTTSSKVSMREIIDSNPELKEQFETFSEDYPDVARLMTSLMEAATEASVKNVNAKVEQFQGSIQNVEQVALETKVNDFWNVVNTKMPDWEITKNDPFFATYLAEVDPISGLQRGVYAQDAIQKLDANRVIAIYTDFRKSRNTNTQNASDNSSTSKPSQSPPANPAADLVAPPSGTRPATPSHIPADQPITAAYIQKFYNDAAIGRYRGKDAEFNSIEARINKAVKEGKVV